MYYESFLYYVQSDDFAWRYEENEEEIRYEDFQEESERTSTVSNIQKRGSRVENRKGKGSFKRKDKYPHRYEN